MTPFLRSCNALAAVAVAVRATRPAAGAPHAFFQLFLRAADSALSGRQLLCFLDPVDELVARELRDVVPGRQCRFVRQQRLAEICRHVMDYSTWEGLCCHGGSVSRRQSLQTMKLPF